MFCLFLACTAFCYAESNYPTIRFSSSGDPSFSPATIRLDVFYETENGYVGKTYGMENYGTIDGREYVCVRTYTRNGAGYQGYSFLEVKYQQEKEDSLLFFQDGDKIYFLPSKDSEASLVLDYGLKEGDEYVSGDGQHFKVVETGYFEEYAKDIFYNLTNETKPKMLRLLSDDGDEDVWIEGLGSINWGIVPLWVVEKMKGMDGRPRSSKLAEFVDFRTMETIIDEKIQGLFNVNVGDCWHAHFYPQEKNEVKDEDYQFYFEGDTLVMTGVWNFHCADTEIAVELIIDKDNVLAWNLNEVWYWYSGNDYARAEVRLPGFKPGTYKLYYDDPNKPLILVCEGSKEENYVPFVEHGRMWHVLGLSVGEYRSESEYYFGQNDKEINGKLYTPMYEGYEGENMYNSENQLCGWFREEGMKVYKYDESTEEEHLVYDFTLDVGDTFAIGWGNEADSCVVTKVGYEKVGDKRLRTITFHSIKRHEPEGEYLHEGHTWVACIGSWGCPTDGWVPNTYESSWSYHLAYVCNESLIEYIPFSFCDLWGSGYIAGQDLVKGRSIDDESYDDVLDYEIVDGKLHVTGLMWLNCGPYSYIYCELLPTDMYNKYQIKLTVSEVPPLADCVMPHDVDMYFEFLHFFGDENMRFVVEDNQGEQHPVERVYSDGYVPIIQQDKLWKAGRYVLNTDPAENLSYYYFDGDTVSVGLLYSKMMCATLTKEDAKMTYMGGVRENGKRVYILPFGMEKEYLMYDFGAHVGDTLEVYCPESTQDTWTFLVVGKDSIESGAGKLCRLSLAPWQAASETFGSPSCVWIEGVGSDRGPCAGAYKETPYGMYRDILMSCVIGETTTLYANEILAEDISPNWEWLWKEGEDVDGPHNVKKQKLDFTHVVKTKPIRNNAPDATSLEGEYDNVVMGLGFFGLDGTYVLTITDEGGAALFSRSLSTEALLSMDILLNSYADGEYTITVENDAEAYIGNFSLPVLGEGIQPLRSSFAASSVYDLSGRRINVNVNDNVNNPKLKKGIYIKDGWKMVIK